MNAMIGLCLRYGGRTLFAPTDEGRLAVDTGDMRMWATRRWRHCSHLRMRMRLAIDAGDMPMWGDIAGGRMPPPRICQPADESTVFRTKLASFTPVKKHNLSNNNVGASVSLARPVRRRQQNREMDSNEPPPFGDTAGERCSPLQMRGVWP